MKRLGAFLIVIGVGSFILPLMGMQFRLISAVGGQQPWAGLAFIGVGGVLLFIGAMVGSRKTSPVVSGPSAPPPMVGGAPPPMMNTMTPPPVILSNQCPRCGAIAQPGTRYCAQCGTTLVAAAAPPPQQPMVMGQMPPQPNPAWNPAAAGPGRSHSPMAALVLALLIPGAGQAYNGQPVKGFFLLFLSALILPWLYSVYDAHASAKRLAATGGRYGRGGFAWVFLQAWLFFNVSLASLIGLTAGGVLR